MNSTTSRPQTILNSKIAIIEESIDLDLYGVQNAKPTWLEKLHMGLHLILDLSKVDYIEGCGFIAIVECVQEARARNLKIAVIPSNRIKHLMQGFPESIRNSIPPFFDNQTDAIHSIDPVSN